MPRRSAATLVRCAALHHGVDEMRGADHHAVDALPLRQHAGRAEALAAQSRMPVVTSSLVGAFTAPRDLAVLDQDGVGVGAADVDADASHARKHAPEVDVVAEGARADMLAGPFGDRKTGGGGRAITVTRWP